MPSYWIKFKDRAPGCVEADDETAAMVAARVATIGLPISAMILPYPAEPRLITKMYKDSRGHEYNIPSFCFTPEQCCGKTSCPRRHSCVE